MKFQQVSQTGTGQSAALEFALGLQAFGLSYGVDVDGTVTYQIQFTLDKPTDPAAVWFNHPTLTDLTANAAGSSSEPLRGIRVNVTAGSGTATLKALSLV